MIGERWIDGVEAWHDGRGAVIDGLIDCGGGRSVWVNKAGTCETNQVVSSNASQRRGRSQSQSHQSLTIRRSVHFGNVFIPWCSADVEWEGRQ